MNEGIQVHQTESGEFIIEWNQVNLKLEQVEFEQFVDSLARFRKLQKARKELNADS